MAIAIFSIDIGRFLLGMVSEVVESPARTFGLGWGLTAQPANSVIPVDFMQQFRYSVQSRRYSAKFERGYQIGKCNAI
jgi:hypothetical protein